MSSLVLSLFPGIGLLDRAFEEEGFCVVRGPDVLWGGDVRHFRPTAGRFDGVIGGPPCQPFSVIRRLLRATGRDTKAFDLIPEFVRCVGLCAPAWWLMENVPSAPDPAPGGYRVASGVIRDDAVGGHTMRVRRYWFGTRDGRALRIGARARPTLLPPERAVTRNCRMVEDRHRTRRAGTGGVLPGDGRYMPMADVCELQGLPRSFADGSPFRLEALRIMLGNGVPLAMGRALARAVREATAAEVTS
jgi:DNA (cytosine-5)-methyltransferase 1